MPASNSPSTEIQGYAMGNGVVSGLRGSIEGPSMIVFLTVAMMCASLLCYAALSGQSLV